jgi:hypothetical protein
MVSEGVLGSIPSTHGFSRRFGCITPLHPTGRPRCPDMGGKKALETSTVNERGGIVAYGVQPGRIQRIYTDNSVYIIRCAVWRVSKIGRGLFSLVVKTPGCYSLPPVQRQTALPFGGRMRSRKGVRKKRLVDLSTPVLSSKEVEWFIKLQSKHRKGQSTDWRAMLNEWNATLVS